MDQVWGERTHLAAAPGTGRRGLQAGQALALVRIQLEREGVGAQPLQPVVFPDGTCMWGLYLASGQAWALM